MNGTTCGTRERSKSRHKIKKTVARGLSINGKTPRNMITDDQAARPKNERPPTHTFKNALVAVQRRRNIGKHEAGCAQNE